MCGAHRASVRAHAPRLRAECVCLYANEHAYPISGCIHAVCVHVYCIKQYIRARTHGGSSLCPGSLFLLLSFAFYTRSARAYRFVKCVQACGARVCLSEFAKIYTCMHTQRTHAYMLYNSVTQTHALALSLRCHQWKKEPRRMCARCSSSCCVVLCIRESALCCAHTHTHKCMNRT